MLARQPLRLTTGRFALGLVVAALLGAASTPGAAVPSPRGAGTCGECHATLTARKNLHGALRSGGCFTCHAPSDQPGKCQGAAAGAGWKLARDCFGCHQRTTVAGAASVHTAVARGQCTGCHDPHSSDQPKLLLAPGSALCLRCHDAKRAGTPGAPALLLDLSRNVHPALEVGECADCHAAHGSPYPKQLKQQLPALCYGCHERMDKDPVVHGAVQLGRCTTCHDPHAAGQPKLLREARQADLCFRCHADDLTGRAHVHLPAAEGECLACHRPHGSAHPKLLTDQGPALCEQCHPDVAGKPQVHAAITRWGCTACHDPHASANDKQLLLEPNALCLKCHAAITGDHVFTAFDGRPHPLEGKPDPSRQGKTLSCVSCHSPHSSDHPRLFWKGSTAQDVCKDCHGKN
jgi:predicted CXXCH cytochrome family protein